MSSTSAPAPAPAPAPTAPHHARKHNLIYLLGLGAVAALCLVGIFTIYEWFKSLRAVLIPLLIGIFSASVFGAIDAIFLLTTETELDDYFEKIGLPSKLTSLMVGAISASLSLIISTYAEEIFAGMDTEKSMWLDVAGIMTGTVLISGAYVVYLKI